MSLTYLDFWMCDKCGSHMFSAYEFHEEAIIEIAYCSKCDNRIARAFSENMTKHDTEGES